MNDRFELGIYAALLLAAALACGGKGDKPSSGQTSPAPDDAKGASAAPATVLPMMKATDLVADYKANEVRADGKYKGHRVRVSGAVGDIKKDLLDNIYVTVGGGGQYEFQQVQAFFSDDLTARASQLNKGQAIAVECDCEGLMVNVIMRRCVFVELPPPPTALPAPPPAAAPPPRPAANAGHKNRH